MLTTMLELVTSNPFSVLIAALIVYITLTIDWESVPQVTVSVDKEEKEDTLTGVKQADPTFSPTTIPCWDPATMNSLGTAPVMSDAEVHKAVDRCKAAQAEWGKSDFKQRNTLLKILLRFIVENQETIARVACRESGKTQVRFCCWWKSGKPLSLLYHR
jgi:delta 1-pyrroline-5-carboxylate dehydrogenase